MKPFDRSITVGDTVTIERGREQFRVVGFELDGQCVQLEDDSDRFTVYAWRVAVVARATQPQANRSSDA